MTAPRHKIDSIEKFIAFLKTSGRPIAVQTHNFPDHDAIASAFGLKTLLAASGISSTIVYGGGIQRDSLREMVARFGIQTVSLRKYRPEGRALVVLVDSCKGNKNISCIDGDVVGVIDHHQTAPPDDVPFVDIRPDYGSCSTIVAKYYDQSGAAMPREVATALLIGINVDTAFLTRGVGEEDLNAYFALRKVADNDYVASNVRNNIQKADLAFFKYAIDSTVYDGEFAFCYFPHGCNPNLLGILADFLLALKEITFVALCAQNEGKIYFSVRSEDGRWNASSVIQSVLEGTGFGGGHFDMAGGIILDPSSFDEKAVRNRFLEALEIGSPHQGVTST